VRDWSFTSKDGDEILGRVYLPPGADESAAGDYPLIVYYYGGTAPVGRGFGGRYPKELWAAQGFVVYVLQPSGTTGFGQEFAARHVNAWGRQTADEILEGTELFLEAHPFVDPERVGAIGASYGGFMTMYLQTRSDLFAAAVSHAGISNLASYWGQGWWGYLYSDAASAGSFPWNNKELYVEQSPLYAADKITTPLLLLHGDADTNVPPVESHQMYTALEVLGKEVELIEIGGQNHTILSLEERRLWTRTILAWFSHHLKDEPHMWQHLWGTEDEPKG
ncbi:MAG: prolyl oligopeptidase family serine peptidase, partial [Acidobacteriota bacterium]